MAMKSVLFLVALVVVKNSWAWNSVAEMESDICVALTNDGYLASTAFVNRLNSATNATSSEMKTEAYLLLSVVAYRRFLNTADARWLVQEMDNASNAVESISAQTNKWQYWMAKFTYASAQVSLQQFTGAYLTLTNTLEEIAKTGYADGNSAVERALLHKYEMPDLRIADAMKVFAGMTAAQLGLGNAATNYANQVPAPYRNRIVEFLR